jgi:rod shape-determining protein MreB
MGGVVVAQSIKVGGESMDQAIVDYLKKNSSMLVGEETAEELKIDLASADASASVNTSAFVRGFDMLSARVMNVEFTAAQARDAVSEACQAILASIRWVLERTPPELSADIMRGGIHLTGGTAQLLGLDHMISSALGIPVQIASNPTDATVMGMGYLLENPDLLSAVSHSAINVF